LHQLYLQFCFSNYLQLTVSKDTVKPVSAHLSGLGEMNKVRIQNLNTVCQIEEFTQPWDRILSIQEQSCFYATEKHLPIPQNVTYSQKKMTF
jgi:hypothetical protein